jgi:antitoxin component YwqK of YwqJK toxin-antitoxin module
LKQKLIFNREDKSKTNYRGHIRADQRCGFGMVIRKNGSIEYIGNFGGDMKHGYGVQFDRDGRAIYRGEFKEDAQCGFGLKFCSKSGRMNRTENGIGRLYEDNGRVIQEGEWRQGRPHGFGIKYDDLGMKTYEGLFKSGIPVYLAYNKPVKIYHKPDSKYLEYNGGERNGLYHGEGTSYLRNGDSEYFGGWSKGFHSGIGNEYSYSYCSRLGKSLKSCCLSLGNILSLQMFRQETTNTITPLGPSSVETPALSRRSLNKSHKSLGERSYANFDVSNFDNNPNYNVISSVEDMEKLKGQDQIKDEFDIFTGEWFTVGMIDNALARLRAMDLADSQSKAARIPYSYFGFFKNNRRIMPLKKSDHTAVKIYHWKEEFYRNGE